MYDFENMSDDEFELLLKERFKAYEQEYDKVKEVLGKYDQIQENADSLIAIGKEAWLKKRKSHYKTKMTDEQQEGSVTEIEMDKELPNE